MISIVCFIVPIILYIITFPLKAIILSMQIRDKIIARKERERNGDGSLLSRIDKWADKDDGQLEKSMLNGTKKTVKASKDVVVGSAKLAKNSVEYAYKGGKMVYKTGKFAYKAGKFAYNTAKFTIKATKLAIRAMRIAIKATITTLKFIIVLIKSLVAMLIALGTVGLVILIVVCIGILAVIVVTVCIPKITDAVATSASVTGGFSGYDYLSIDWSQDFTAKLNEIESTYGAQNKHHAELVVLNMRTLQKNTDISLDPSTWVGIKRVESGNEVFKDDSSSVFSNYSTVYPNNNGYNCYGPFQINLKDSAHAWTLFNSEYTPSDSAPSAMSGRDETYGNIFFYPDLSLGTNKAYSKDLTAWVAGESGARGYSSLLSDVKTCFEDLKVDYSDAKAKKVLEFMLANSYNEGSIHTLKEDPHKTIIKLYIEFFNTYGWERSDLHLKLIKSMVNTSSKDGKNKNIYVPNDPQTTWVWGSNASTFNNSMNVGVLDKGGSPISKSLYGYLADGNSTLQSGIGSFSTDNDSIMSARTYYGVAVYVVGTWEIEKTIDYLGLRSQMKKSGDSGASSSTLMGIIDRECKADDSVRIHYETETASSDDAQVADCSRFIARVLTELGCDPFGITSANHKGFTAHDDFHECVTEAQSNGGGVTTGTEKKWVIANQPESIIYNGKEGGLDISKLQPGDVCYAGGGESHHVVFYTGKNSSGVETIAHSSHTGGTGCSKDLNDLSGGYSVGYSNFYDQGEITFVFRPSLFK